MRTMTIRQLLQAPPSGGTVTVQGWVRTKRRSRHVCFITLHDGSCQPGLQLVGDTERLDEAVLKEVVSGASLRATGRLMASPGPGQPCELQVEAMTLLGSAPAYPLQPKRHSLAFLRTIPHLRFRTNTFHAVFRLRHEVSRAIHAFLHEQGCCYLHTPIITGMDAEGAGQLFEVSKPTAGKGTPFFHQQTYLTVSGQLAAEAGTMGLGRVYTFGPTFRAEDSNTPRHLAEFWMVEAEMAFYELQDIVGVAEGLIKYVVRHALKHCGAELAFLERAACQAGGQEARPAKPLRARLEEVAGATFAQITYAEALQVLARAAAQDPQRFQYAVAWGKDLQTEHERYLTEVHVDGPVVVTDYPAELKAFYMRQQEDGKTVAAMDLLVPGVGELVGGSQREERYEKLVAALDRRAIPHEPLAWYLDTRRFGTVVHSGFGLGLERLLQWMSGMHHIRDVIPFPRTPGHAPC